MNFGYRREFSAETDRRVRRDSTLILVMWGGLIALLMQGQMPWRVFVVWFAVVSVISFVNTLRTLVAHRYESEGTPLPRAGQLLDSIDLPGRFWTELWAPVGLRYHALHHYFPGVPYHNLPAAHRRLISSLPSGSVYSSVSGPGLWACLRMLYLRGSGK
jgi:fatty acid desaturase